MISQMMKRLMKVAFNIHESLVLKIYELIIVGDSDIELEEDRIMESQYEPGNIGFSSSLICSRSRFWQ